MSVLEHALFLSQKKRISVVPIDDGKKIPPKDFRWKQWQTEIMPESQVKAHFGYANRMALITGKVSNHLECIDFDLPGRYEEWRELLDNNGHAELTARLVVEATPRGGAHVYYHCPDGIEGNQKLARRFATDEELASKPLEKAKATIETRGEGGLVVAFPSDGYCSTQGLLSNIPTITGAERRLLINLARSFEEVLDQPAEQVRKEMSGDPDSLPGTDYNNRGDWHEILPSIGWRYLYSARGRSYWERPGKSQKEVSATTGNGPNDLLYVFSTSCYPLESEHCYSKFAVIAYCNHNGDFSAARKYLLSQGYGEKPSYMPSVPHRVEALSDSTEELDANNRRWSPLSYSSLMQRPKRQMLVEGLIGEQDNFMIYGAPKSGKTFVAIDLICACVCGGTFADVFDISRPLTVAYMTNEGLGSIGARLRACLLFNDVPLKHLDDNLSVYEDVPQLYQCDGPNSIRTFVKDWIEFETKKLDILIIDTLNKASLGADENSNSDAAIIATNLMYARRELGCATGIIHHSGRDGNKSRGASAFDGDLDVQFKVAVDDYGIRTFALSFAKDLSGFEPIAFKLTQVTDSDEPPATQWLGTTELKEGDTALAQIALLMRNTKEREWWTRAQIREFLPKLSSEAIRKALGREVQRPNGIIRAMMEPEGRQTAVWGYKWSQ